MGMLLGFFVFSDKWKKIQSNKKEKKRREKDQTPLILACLLTECKMASWNMLKHEFNLFVFSLADVFSVVWAAGVQRFN